MHHLAREEPPRTPQEDPSTTDSPTKPEILITTDITAVVNAAEEALLKQTDKPQIFQRLKQLCVVAHGTPAPRWLTRAPDAPSLVALEAVQLRERMNQVATWQKYSAREKKYCTTLPPDWAVQTLLKRLDWRFPVLSDIISSPTIRADGELITAPGYDVGTGLFLDTQGVTFPPIPMRPSRNAAIDAVLALKEPFVDFPYAAAHGQSATIAAILAIVGRPAIKGCVPLSAVRSTMRGGGKGLIVDVVTTIATGRPAPRWAQVQDEDEDRKRLLTLGIDGDETIHIDNVTAPLGSGPLDSALTATTFKDRLLGQNKTLEVPMRAVFFASGNNMLFKGDTARRVVPIDLEPMRDNPEDRDDFTYPLLLEWVGKERPRLVVAALTILRAYFVAGCPKQSVSYGSFETWNDIVRSALIWADLPDPCEGRKSIEAESDMGYETLATLLHCWQTCYGGDSRTLKAAVQDIMLRAINEPTGMRPPNEWNDLYAALAAFDSRHDGKRLDELRIGNALRTIRGRVLGGQRFIQDGTYNRAAKWRVHTL